MPLKDAVATVLNRNAFYRDGYRLLLRLSVVQGIVIVFLVASIVLMAMSMDTRYVYFATTSDGRIINIVPLNEAFRTDADVIAWAAGAAQNTMRFGYNDYRQRLQQASANFTSTGWESFTKALKDGRYMEALEARKLVVSMEIEAAPEIKKKGVAENGVYTWYVQIPIIIKFDGNDPPMAIHAMLILQIVRVSTLQNPDGISIEQWIAGQKT